MRILMMTILLIVFSINTNFSQNIVKTDTNTFIINCEQKGVLEKRIEIYSHPATVKWIFKLDKFTGEIFLLTYSNKKDSLFWEKMEKEYVDNDINKDNNSVNYELILSNLNVKYSILYNINTGSSWYLFIDMISGKSKWRSLRE